LLRIGNLRPFRLAAGASAIRNPWKLLFGICDELSDLTLLGHIRKLKNNWTENEEVLLLALLNTKQNCPLTTSMGRLFDAISSLLTFTGDVEFEAQAAMSLEFEAMLWFNPEESDDSLLPWVKKQDYYILDWEPMIRKILSSLANRDITAYLAHSFHSSLARCIFDLAQQLQVKNIVLSGGVFQNRLLLQEIFKRSKINGIKVNLPQRYPVNDGGIALGQLLTVINQEKRSL
jgi:hydrogenase maturation protein HypF